MFTGLSAFPLTPLRDDQVDLAAYGRLIDRLVAADVDSISALGSTGSYAYLDRAERREVAAATVEHAGRVPVLIGVGALRTSQVRALAADAQEVGADAVLLAPVSYQALTEDDVAGLYEDVTAELSVPLVVYDNPGTTHFTFTLDLYAHIASLPHVEAIKIPPTAGSVAEVRERVQEIRAVIPEQVRLGISGDGFAATGLLAGCDAWFSVLGGTLPHAMAEIARPALAGDDAALAESERLAPLWELFSEFGSLRVTAAIAEHLGQVDAPCLPRPLLRLTGAARDRVRAAVEELGLRD
ncbi:dihydrodipicolinate synthase family protein [Brachybacterium fresconis]|uniref:4-hydroxy-tetrahydrodipicolinate synthase n=1 Tax=Brachybacterium fresconis TaxID=173363 RepID=A0ABS4YNI7_9MICO|nr:dihydrodipicolinate synthase family protein [Brachybacterium fresconis]MBP2410314.1 4-hydroxy-tetrahydrodipicolinate synthase [Brachybacterium fresconis]